MAQIKFDTGEELIAQLPSIGNVHIECSQEMGDALFELLLNSAPQGSVGCVLRSDIGYERQSVKSYLRFWAELQGKKQETPGALERFGLKDIAEKKLPKLSVNERMRVQLARVSLQEAEIYFLEEPLLNLDSENTGRVLKWMEERCGQGKRFVTVNASLRHALLMPGTAFYLEEGRFCQVEEEDAPAFGEGSSEEDIRILKIPAKSGNTMLLFEPGDIDFVESLNKSNYLSVRGTLFQVARTMDELEGTLGKCGFFRCHRSYIVNMQRVGQIERLSRNSFCLLLEDKDKTRIPLSKGRIQEMKETFGWQDSF